MKLYIKLSDFLTEKLSNLNENFWVWFGDSKIKTGKTPTICYHGSKSDISIFDFTKIGYNSGNYGHYGYGIYFSTDIREAKTYGDKIHECYLKIINPFTGTNKQILELKKYGVLNIDDLDIISIDFKSFKQSFVNNKSVYKFLSDVEKYGIEYTWNNIRELNPDADLGFLNDISNTLEYTTYNNDVYVVPDYVLDDLKNWNIKPKLNKGFKYEQSLHWITDLGKNSKEVTDVIKKLGYDGVVYGSEIVVFNANQIKSIKNDGTWSLNDDNIYH